MLKYFTLSHIHFSPKAVQRSTRPPCRQSVRATVLLGRDYSSSLRKWTGNLLSHHFVSKMSWCQHQHFHQWPKKGCELPKGGLESPSNTIIKSASLVSRWIRTFFLKASDFVLPHMSKRNTLQQRVKLLKLCPLWFLFCTKVLQSSDMFSGLFFFIPHPTRASVKRIFSLVQSTEMEKEETNWPWPGIFLLYFLLMLIL